MMNTLQRRLVTYFTDLSPRFSQRTGITTEKMSPKKSNAKRSISIGQSVIRDENNFDQFFVCMINYTFTF